MARDDEPSDDSDDRWRHTLHSILPRMQRGERPSEAQLDEAFGKHIGWLGRRCTAELRGFGRQVVEEAVQDTLLIAWARLCVLEYRDQGKPFRVWLGAIALNVCRNLRTKRCDSLSADGLLEPGSGEDSALSQVLRQERLDRLGSVAEAVLSPEEQEIFLLRYLHEYSHEQIAEYMGFEHKDRVRVALQRILRRLRAGLRPEPPDEE